VKSVCLHHRSNLLSNQAFPVSALDHITQIVLVSPLLNFWAVGKTWWMPSPKPVWLELSDEERQVLRGWTRRRTTAQTLALRSRIVLECAQGRSNTEIAASLAVSRETVRKWRLRFVRDRPEGLTDEPRPGAPRKITDEQVERVITRPWSISRCAVTPTGRPGRWQRPWGMSQSAISRIWRAWSENNHVSTAASAAAPVPGPKIRGEQAGVLMITGVLGAVVRDRAAG
jgi:transposase